jgi:hypothetical protein
LTEVWVDVLAEGVFIKNLLAVLAGRSNETVVVVVETVTVPKEQAQQIKPLRLKFNKLRQLKLRQTSTTEYQ